MPIYVNKNENIEFHLTNSNISYIFTVLKNGHLGHLYFGKKVSHQNDFSHLLINRSCILSPTIYGDDLDFSLETIKQEYPVFGKGDYRQEAFRITASDGSYTNNPSYLSHKIYEGKKEIKSLPSTWCENENEISSLEIKLYDSVQEYEVTLNYHIFNKIDAISRSSTITNKGKSTLSLNKALSFNLDFEHSDFDLLTFNGAWSRERHISKQPLHQGIQKIESLRGASSANHNPSFILQDKNTTELSGEAYGFSLIYSGNFEANVQVDHYNTARVQMGINSNTFTWKLEEDQSFQTPEALLCYSDSGLNQLSNIFHQVTVNNIMKSNFRKKERPLLLNNWEATYFNFTEEGLLNLATKAKEIGIELFVLDDGWFGKRDDDTSSLGDWYTNKEKLPNGISYIAKKIKDLGLKFGLWFEVEMVNLESELYKNHPDWVICAPKRKNCFGRNQFVLDFSNDDVVNYIFDKMSQIIDETQLDYIKWDMNRNITEPYAMKFDHTHQGEFFHRYILGVYKLYEMLNNKYPSILFESCASGGNRFDLGMMYYAPQAWTSDNTDAVERLKIQYGTSLIYPLCSMGSHVSAIPNHQVGRETSLKFRSDVAYFGTFGYELDITKATDDELEKMKKQIVFFKEYRYLIQYGTFTRLKSPFENNEAAWMVTSKDKKTAILAYYKILAKPNPSLSRIKVLNLDENLTYKVNNKLYKGDELTRIGLPLELQFNGSLPGDKFVGKHTKGTDFGDFTSQIYIIKAI